MVCTKKNFITINTNTDGVVAVGSGGEYALAAAKGVLSVSRPDMDPEEICRNAMTIAAEVSFLKIIQLKTNIL